MVLSWRTNWDQSQKKCENCGGPFFPSAVNNGTQKYCGKICRQQAREKRKRNKLEQKDGFVYFIEGAGLVKIGHSTCPKLRLAKLQTGSPVKLRLVRVEEAPQATEMKYHERFRHLRSHGEWFKAEQELSEFLRIA